MEYYLNQTNILNAYAGALIDNKELLSVSSGGIASAIATDVIERGGVVYGATYSDNFYCANYLRVETKQELYKLRGSKYCYVRKEVCIDGLWRRVYDAVCEDLDHEKEVMFVGLGCDVAVLKKACQNRNISTKRLLLVELLCDGVTDEQVHCEYIKGIESLHRSEIVEFTVRNKRDGWVPIYVYAKFRNGEEHMAPFYDTPYGFSFAHYKNIGCYTCKFKGSNHFGDLIIGDYRGCEPGMPEYNKNGVSIIYTQTVKGEEYLRELKEHVFVLNKTDAEYALRHSPRFFVPHPMNPNWTEYKELLEDKGLFGVMAHYFGLNTQALVSKLQDKEIVMWGVGGCFHKFAHYIMEYLNVSYVVDNDCQKWDKNTEFGIVCHEPDYIKGKNVFVIIMIEDVGVTCQIINELLEMNIFQFENVYNVIRSFDISKYKSIK